MNEQKSYRSSFILLTTLFFLWGFITVLVYSLIPGLRELFTLSYFQTGMVQFAFFGMAIKTVGRMLLLPIKKR